MVFIAKLRWIVILVLHMVKHINCQIPMSMFAHPVFGMPPPPPMQMEIAVPMLMKSKKSTTTTTTSEKPVAYAVHIPLPMQMPMVMPAPLPQPFFPYGPPPMYPPGPPFGRFPPFQRRPHFERPRRPKWSGSSTDTSSGSSSESSSSSGGSSDWSYRKIRNKRKGRHRGRRGKRKRKFLHRGNRRRNLKDSNSDSSRNFLVKPVLTYISKNGDVKFKKRISQDTAEVLMDTNEIKASNKKSNVRTVQVMTRNNPDDQSQVLVVSGDGGGSDPADAPADTRKQFVLGNDATSHVLDEGRKQLVFKPSHSRRITNLSVSFQVA